ncbi:membrane integrity-associated transporter subunit PqiC, partial [candidate division KSB1 bacterium]|nr:membrane integrity-associated transporter subunit PqiC [candidate division KSB1 bacterium]
MYRCVMAGMLFLLFACGQMPQTHYYTLNVSPPKTDAAVFPHPLWIKNFTAAAMYDQDCLLYRSTQHEIKFDHYRRWVSPPTDLLQSQLTAYLRALGIFRQVSLILPRQQPYYVLSAEILQFEESGTNDGRGAGVRLWIELNRSDLQEVVWQGYVE